MAKPIGHDKEAVERVRRQQTKRLYADSIKNRTGLQIELLTQYIKDHYDTAPAALENALELAKENMKDVQVILNQ